MQQFRWLLKDGMFKFTRGCGENTLTKNYDRFFDKISKYESKFFEAINKAIETKNWVDIESIIHGSKSFISEINVNIRALFCSIKIWR